MVAVFDKVIRTIRTGQVETHEGGTAYAVDDWTRLRRFLILGSEGGNFYVREHQLTRESAAVVVRCLDADPARTVDEIVAVSDAGRAPKTDPAIFALALAACHPAAAPLALAALPKVCRTGTHLFHFMQFTRGMGRSGRALRTAVGRWYGDMPLDRLAYQVVKYRQRDGWTHADVLRRVRPKATDPTRNALYRWIVRGETTEGIALPALVTAYETAKALHPERAELVKLIVEQKLPREALPTEALGRADVWDALLAEMPMTAMLRNLGTMSKVGLLVPGSDAARLVCARLNDAERLRQARAHPIAVLVALRIYAQGHGERGSATWAPAPKVVDALDDAFYAAFGAVESTGATIVLGIDLSGSMGHPIAGMPLTCREGAAVMAMATARTEPNYEIVGYTDTIIPVTITPRMRLDDVLQAMQVLPQWTKCSLPIKWARQMKIKADAIVSYTDSETSDHDTYPALLAYRQWSGTPTRGAVVAMANNPISLFPADDPGCLGVVGFDTATPQVIAGFVGGQL